MQLLCSAVFFTKLSTNDGELMRIGEMFSKHYLRFLILKGHIASQNVHVLHVLLHVWVSGTMIKYHTTNQPAMEQNQIHTDISNTSSSIVLITCLLQVCSVKTKVI